MTITIGTSGWAYREWKGVFYPKSLPPDRQLDHYVTKFSAVEINGTAYRTPTIETVRRWASVMPSGFIAAVKLSHGITHFLRLRDASAALANFILPVRTLGDHLGPLLAQLPPGLTPDHTRLGDFLREARAIMADPTWPLVVEFRHAGWITPQTAELLDHVHATWCVADMPSCPVLQPTPGASCLYIRRHGTNGRYRGSYSDLALRRDAADLCCWSERGLPAYIFFNNTADGAAVQDALRLHDMVRAAQKH